MIKKVIWKDDKKTRDMISQLINDKKLFPVFGSGFTAGCKAKNGVVPSGTDMKEYMKEFLSRAYNKDAADFNGRSFPDLCTLYSKKSTTDEKFDYFSSNFTEVIIEEEKKQFLLLFTQYVYTLNIDDGIEHNCSQFNVLLPNIEIYDQYIERYTTVFKLHGDVCFYLKNIENESIIFNKKEYIESIKKNGKMLAKLKEDFADKNIIYIGCSLDDEPDLLSIVAEAAKERLAESQAFYITRRDIDEEMQDLLEEYGITTIVKIENYISFFADIISLCSGKTNSTDFFDNYHEPEFVRLGKEDISIDTLLNSNSIVPSPFEGIINLPPYYIKRDILDDVLSSLKYHSPIHIIYGNRISGKTFVLIGLMDLIQDKSRYYFPSNVKISDERINALLEKTNCAFIFDTNTLDEEQLQRLIKMKSRVARKGNYVVLTINTSERNGIDLISTNNNYGFTKVRNVFSGNEIEQLNKKLQIYNLPTFINKEAIDNPPKSFLVSRTLLDNLYMIYVNQKRFQSEKNLPDFLTLSQKLSYKKLALLIILATNKKISSYELSYFDIREEAAALVKEYPVLFEVGYHRFALPIIDSIYKFDTNSRYYLLKYLGDFSKSQKKYDLIVDSYKYIYKCIKEKENDFVVPRKMLSYLRFDILSDIFYKNNNSTTDLIKYIYEKFEDELNISPQFKHQRAKSILWRFNDDLSSMHEAKKYIELAKYDTKNILKSRKNDKLEISLEHIKYTQSIIYGRICALEEYSNSNTIRIAVQCYLEALTSDNNKLELDDIREKKTYKFIYADLQSLIEYVNNNSQDYSDIINNCRVLKSLISCT